MDVASFEAWEYRADGGLSRARFRLEGGVDTGWQLLRNERAHLFFGPGFVPLAVRACGVCATDLARRFLPFPLPQVLGHELLAEGADGGRRVVEINASCRARGLAPCATCVAGLARHCPTRRVLGIHDLPGGFGPYVLAAREAVMSVPDGLADETAVLTEPFAAALHAARNLSIRPGDRVAVLGPRRLGMLVIAALAAERRRTGADHEIVAWLRRPELAPLARALGADAVGEPPAGEGADVVVDTTGSPEGLAVALASARRELHLKSTHGRPAGGLRHATALVVDELSLEPLEAGAEGDAVVVRDGPGADAAIRPDPGGERIGVPPCSRLLVHPDARRCNAPLLREVARRGLRVTTSRCGGFRAALDAFAADPELRELGPRMVTHRFGPDALPRAFETAASHGAIKVLVEHPR